MLCWLREVIQINIILENTFLFLLKQLPNIYPFLYACEPKKKRNIKHYASLCFSYVKENLKFKYFYHNQIDFQFFYIQLYVGA